MKPTILNERYRLVELIGAGGMAAVYRGEDLLLERPVAVKFLREPHRSAPEARERFLQEARAAARLDHPNIVHVYDVGQDEGGHPYMVMELVPGEDLKSLIRREAPLTVPHALSLIRQVCAGVGRAHREGIVHCDLKPQNILVTESQELKVADFGIAQAVRQDEPETEEPAEVVWGSPHYLSPEQARGGRPTPASDVYSIGVILFELLTGVPPFHDQDPTQLAMKHLREPPPSLNSLNPRVPPGLDWLVRKVLSKSPGQRFRNADQFSMAIDEYVRRGRDGTRPFPPVADETPPVASVAAQSLPASAAPDHPTPPPGYTSGAATGSAVENDALHTQPVAQGREDDDERGGFDAMLWVLMGVAAIAVIGLIPLWIFVYQAYSAPAVVPTPILTRTVAPPTPGPEELVTVPNLMGLSAADAQRMAQSLGLDIDVVGEEETSDARPGAVLEQTPGPGQRVTTESVISVILAAGRALEMPDVMGYDLDAVLEGLESDGLLVVVEQVRDTTAAGTILEQIPDAAAEIRAGDTVTLTVSGGSNVPIVLGVNLNDQVILEQAWVTQFNFAPGGSVPVTLRWRCTQPFGSSYKVFIHILTPDLGTLVAQQDVEPVNGLRPTTSWTPGEIINDPHQVVLPQDVAAGVYQIRVGLYDDGGRLSVADPGDAQVVDNTIFVTQIEVRP